MIRFLPVRFAHAAPRMSGRDWNIPICPCCQNWHRLDHSIHSGKCNLNALTIQVNHQLCDIMNDTRLYKTDMSWFTFMTSCSTGSSRHLQSHWQTCLSVTELSDPFNPFHPSKDYAGTHVSHHPGQESSQPPTWKRFPQEPDLSMELMGQLRVHLSAPGLGFQKRKVRKVISHALPVTARWQL